MKLYSGLTINIKEYKKQLKARERKAGEINKIIHQFEYRGICRYKHMMISDVCWTEGVQFLVEKANAFWLVNEIAFSQKEKRIKHEEFQMWILSIKHDSSAQIVCYGTDKKGMEVIIYQKEIEYTDFPLKNVSFYVAKESEHKVIKLWTESMWDQIARYKRD